MGLRSRAKGKRIERDACAYLASLGFPGMARTAQNCGKHGDAPDITGECLRGVHLEIKGDESIDLNKLSLGSACSQAFRDAHGKPWAVLWKRNRSGWRLTVEGHGGARCTYDTATGIQTCLVAMEERAKGEAKTGLTVSKENE